MGAGASAQQGTATAALADAKAALADAKAELVQAVERQHERQQSALEAQLEAREQQAREDLRRAAGSSGAAAAQYVSERSAFQDVGTIELAEPSVEERKSSVVATLGAAHADQRRLIELLNCGVNAVRINMSHATRESAKAVADGLRDYLHGNPGKVCGLLVELAGAEARVGWLGEFADDQLRPGHECIISCDPGVAAAGSSAERFFVGHGAVDGGSDWASAADSTLMLAGGVSPGTMLHIKAAPAAAAALVTLQVVECGGMVAGQDIAEDEIRCSVVRAGRLTARARVFLPSELVAQLPLLSEKDLADLRWAVEAGADAVIVPCVRSAAHMEAARQAVAEACDDGSGENVQLVAKIECAEAVRNFNDILHASDGVFVARAELAAEIGAIKAVLVQKMMVAKANRCGKPVLCGSPLLGSMANRRALPKRPVRGAGAEEEGAGLPPPGEAPELTRGEASDVANALIDGADGLVLTYETSVGSWPVEAVCRLHELCLESESVIDSKAIGERLRAEIGEPLLSAEAVAAAAVAAAQDQRAALLLVLTGAGLVGRLVTKYHPLCPVLLVCESERVARQAYLSRGLVPMVARITKPGIDAAVAQALVLAQTVGYCRRGDNVVLVLDADLVDSGQVTMRAFAVD